MSSPTEWHRRLAGVRAAHVRHFAGSPSAVHEVIGRVEVVVTGVHSNSLNGVLSRATDATGPAVARALAVVAEHGVPATWLVLDDEVPAAPLPALVGAGCRPDLTGWLRAGPVEGTLALARGRPASSGLAVRPVRDARQVEGWLDVAAAVWGHDLDTPAGDRARRLTLMTAAGLSAGAPWQHWVARDGRGRAVGGASAFTDLTSRAVLVEHLNTVPDARRRGVATALLRAALELATSRGCRHVVLEPSPEGVPLYDALGLVGHQPREPREYYLPG